MTDSTDEPADQTTHMNDTDDISVALKVTYDTDSNPSQISFRHNTFGMMKFRVSGGVATLDYKWDRLGDGYLKEGFERTLTTGDVLRSVERLPFVESIEVDYGE